jgi:hypothetical protein
MRAILVLGLLAAPGCLKDDSPTMHVGLTKDSALITLLRSPDHTFDKLGATINGISAGPAKTYAGSDGITFSQAASGARAVFTVPRSQLGSSIHIELSEGDERFVFEAPAFGAARNLTLLTAIDQPLHASDWVEVSSGVPNDLLSGGMSGMLDGALCFTQWDTDIRASSTRYRLPPNLVQDWYCGTQPAAGSVVSIQLSIDLTPEVRVTTCSGPSLTCMPIELDQLTTSVPVTVQI